MAGNHRLNYQFVKKYAGYAASGYSITCAVQPLGACLLVWAKLASKKEAPFIAVI
jgi:hypothetical protein